MCPKFHYNMAVQLQPITTHLEFRCVKERNTISGAIFGISNKQLQNKLPYDNKRHRNGVHGVMI